MTKRISLVFGVLMSLAAISLPAQELIELEYGFAPDPYIVEEDLDLEASIIVDVGLFDSGNPVETGSTYEYYTTFRGPTYLINYDGAGSSGVDLHFSIASSWDLLIGVYAPDGNWYRNDDAVFLYPAVTVPSAPAGLYEVVVYGFEPATVDVALGISEIEQFHGMDEYIGGLSADYYDERPSVAYVTFDEGEYWIEDGSVYYEPPVTRMSSTVPVYVIGYDDMRGNLGELDANGRPIVDNPDGPLPLR